MTDGERFAGGPFEAVAIGASAGGIEALMRLLPALPEHLDAAVFVVLHLPRDRPSLLAGIFAPKCRLPVVEAEDKLAVEPGAIYLAPPDYHLLIDRGPQISLSADPPVHWSRPSIDVMFESAADCFGPRLLGIILTGYSADGAAGLAAIHAAGGTTVVQSPDSAQASLMPRSALDRVRPHHVLGIDAIAERLTRLAATPRAPSTA